MELWSVTLARVRVVERGRERERSREVERERERERARERERECVCCVFCLWHVWWIIFAFHFWKVHRHVRFKIVAFLVFFRW